MFPEPIQSRTLKGYSNHLASRFTASALSGWLLAMAGPLSAGMTHRWSFNGTAGDAPAGTALTDSISGAVATVRGLGATLNGSALVLPGTTSSSSAPATISAYLDLPNGLVSSRENLTLEIWATVISHKSSQRLFEFGRTNISGDAAKQGAGAMPGEILSTATATASGMSASDNLMLAVNRGTSANTQRVSARLDGGTAISGDTTRTIALNTRYHYVCVFRAGVGTHSATGGQMLWYQNGTLVTTQNVPFGLTSIEDVNNWLGRSQTAGDSCSNVSYDELRLHDHAMTQLEISASMAAGPNPAFSAPVAMNDAFEINPGQLARFPVLRNDTGILTASTLVVLQAPLYGTATTDGSGRVIYQRTTPGVEQDTFTYRVSGSGGMSAPASVTVNFSNSLRLPGLEHHVPASPPPVSLRAVNAFPSLNFTQPICAASPPEDGKRLFIGSRLGSIRMIPDVTALPATSSVVLSMNAGAGGLFEGRVPGEALVNSPEMGLLGMAFHPEFATNGYLFLSYSVLLNGKHHHRVSRITLDNHTGSAPTANPSSEFALIEQEDNAVSHNGGDIHFGPDGYLYISLGDEGGQNDQHQNGQRINKDFFAGIMRIDVDKKPGNLEPNPHPNPADYPAMEQQDAVKRDADVARYAVPLDNPFVHTSQGGAWDGSFNGIPLENTTHVRSEFWAVGLRHPWRMWVDPLNGDIWCGDVGGDLREEIALVRKGENHGWGYLEGDQPGPRANPPAGFSPTAPVYQYTHPIPWGSTGGPFQGYSVTGGFIYRGERIPELKDAYIFADYVSGHVWSLIRNQDGPPTVTRILGEAGIAAFAQDPSNGDILLLDYPDNRILRITLATTAEEYPATLSQTELFSSLADLSPAPGLLPYSVNLSFWSDHAVKRRWFTIPGTTATMDFSKDSRWSFPDGQIWVKHFDLELTRGDPSVLRRMETRLLVKNADGAYGVSYRWNDEGTEAYLMEDAGQEFEVPVTVDGNPHFQRWRIPSRSDCLTCHTPQAGHALSFNTRQINMDAAIHGHMGNQLSLLAGAGYFSDAVGQSVIHPRHTRPDESEYSLETRVRSYLAVNCGYCHHPGGTAAPAQWDGRPQTRLFETGLIHGLAMKDGGDPNKRLVYPSHPERSILLHRLTGAQGFGRMPPLGSNEVDQSATNLLTEWINESLPTRKTYAQWRSVSFGSDDSPEGMPEADPDSDGFTNRNEFILGTQPRSGAGFFVPHVLINDTTATVSFTLPTGRRGIVEVSNNLMDWQTWDVPGNNGVPTTDGHHVLIGTKNSAVRFIRVRVEEL